MSDFLRQTEQYRADLPLPWLAEFQQRHGERWEKVVFPTRKTENWKYTNLKVVESGTYYQQAPQRGELTSEALADYAIAGLETFDLVFVNGYFDSGLSSPLSALPEGVVITPLSHADETLHADITGKLGSVINEAPHEFASLNAAALQDGVYVKVERNAQVEQPIRVLNIIQRQETQCAITARVFVELGDCAQACVVEQFASESGELNTLVNSITELDVGASANLRHYRLHIEDESSLHIGGVHAALKSSANLDSFHLALGSKLKRIDCVVNHLGQGAHCDLNGVYLPKNKQHVDYHTCIEHAVPRCTTNEVFRGIVADQAKAVFNGRIHIHKDAQKTLAQLSNKNLLTSNKAEVDTKPELEIYADDVQCAHGATVAQLDDTSLHYCMTRGISKDDARMMLSFAFINELVNGVHHSEIADFLRPQLASLFSRAPFMSEVTE